MTNESAIFPSPTRKGGTDSSGHMGTNDESAKICSRQKQIIRCVQQHGYSPNSVLSAFYIREHSFACKVKKN